MKIQTKTRAEIRMKTRLIGFGCCLLGFILHPCQAQVIAPQSLILPPKSVDETKEELSIAPKSVRKMPVLKDTTDTKAYFGATNFSAVDNVSFSISPNGSALFAEFLSDYLYLGKKVGYARVGFGALVETGKANKTEGTQNTEPTSISQFLSTGGNGMMYIFVPMLSASTYHDGYELARASVVFLPRVGVDIPALNGAVLNPAYNVDTGIEMQGIMRSASKLFQFFGQVRGSFVFGSSDFYANVGLPLTRQQPFVLGRWTAGVDLASLVRISITKAFINTHQFSHNPTILSVQLVNRIKR
jgi:hypothetical protein